MVQGLEMRVKTLTSAFSSQPMPFMALRMVSASRERSVGGGRWDCSS